MPDIGLSYSAAVLPAEVAVQFRLSFSGATVRATVSDVQDFAVLFTPTGDVGEQIVSGIALPLADTLGALLPSLGKDLIRGNSFDLFKVAAATHTVEGETITVTPGNLRMSALDDLLLVQATLDIG